MIIELSKDKSLKNILLKANIDNDTMSLVKADAHISDIKNSLIENLNSSNMVQYRKYIAKAEDEEERREREEQAKIEEERDKETQRAMGIYQEESISDLDAQGDLSSEIKDTSKIKTRKTGMKKIISEVKFLLKIKNATKSLLNVKVRKAQRGENTPSGFVITGQEAFKFFTESKSKQYMTLIRLLKTNEGYLATKYKRFMNAEGILDMGTKDENDDVNIIILTKELINIANTPITYETKRGNKQKPFIEVFKDLYENTYEKSAIGRRNKQREKVDFERFVKRVNDEELEDREFEDALKVLNKLKTNIEKLADKADILRKLKQQLRETEETDAEEIIEMKIKRMMDAIEVIQDFETRGKAKVETRKTIREKPAFQQKGKGNIEIADPKQSLDELKEKYGDIETFVRELRRLDKKVGRPKGMSKNMQNSIISAYDKIKEISENKEKFIEEAVQELIEELEKEIETHTEIVENIDGFIKFEKDIEIIESILKKLDDDPEIYDKEGVRNINVQQVIEESTKDIEGPKTNVARQNYIESQQESLKDKLETLVKLRAKSIKRKITSVINKLNNAYSETKKIVKLMSKVEDMTKQEYRDWLSGKTSKPRAKEPEQIALGNLITTVDFEEFEGISLFNESDLGKLDRASSKLQNTLGALKAEKDKLQLELNKKIRFDEEEDKSFIYKEALA